VANAAARVFTVEALFQLGLADDAKKHQTAKPLVSAAVPHLSDFEYERAPRCSPPA
jgi:hypothetical protein